MAAVNVVQDLWRRAGGEPEALAALDVIDDGPVLPSTFRVTDAAVATVAATTLAAARLWQERGGPESIRARAGARESAAAFRSERYLRLVRPDGARVPMAGQDDRTGDYRTRDGWIRLHCNYPAHRAAVDTVLGAGDPSDWAALDLEEAVVAAGGAAAALRSRSEWASHPQGRAVARLPLLGRARGSGQAPPLPSAARPLGGVRVLDLTRVIAGPVAGRILAAHGAQVLRVGADHLALVPDLVVDTGFGKRFTHLDLRGEEGREALRRLVVQADVVLQAFRPGALARLGFGPDGCAALSPGLVYVEVSAWGQTGPWNGRRGFDSLVQVACGIADEGRVAAGSALGPPCPLPAQALDHATGFLAALGAIQALRHRHATGEGSRVQVSLAATAAWLDSLGRDPSGPSIADPGLDDVADLLIEDETPYGRVSHVRPPGHIDGAPPRWTSPPQRPGADTPVWT